MLGILLCFATLEASTSKDSLLIKLEQGIQKGDKRSLRDLGTILNDSRHRKAALNLLDTYTLFESIDVRNISREAFLDFIYENYTDIKYSYALKSFTHGKIEDFSKLNIKVNVLDDPTLQNNTKEALYNHLLLEFKKSMMSNDDEAILEAAYKLSLFSNQNHRALLDAFLYLDKKKDAKLIEEFSRVLTNIKEPEILDLLIAQGFQEERLSKGITLERLASLTNTFPDDNVNIKLFYQIQLDENNDLTDLIERGFNKNVSFKPSFFEDPVDYYGNIYFLYPHKPWLQDNALHYLLQNQHPRTLFYLAAALLHAENYSKTKQILISLEQVTRQRFMIENKNTKDYYRDFHKLPFSVKRQFAIYFAKHYHNYEWDNRRHYFIDKLTAQKLDDYYDFHFNRLASENDKIAWESFDILCESDPNIVAEFASKYRNLFIKFNNSLPSFKYYHIEQITKLQSYCKVNKIQYIPNDKLAVIYDSLLLDLTPQKRYFLEERLLRTLTLNTVTSLETFALKHERNTDMSYSVARILDIFYSKNWSVILEDQEQLRLYLKKGRLFKDIGTAGICSNYLSKFDLDKDENLMLRLRIVASMENDEDIINQISSFTASTGDKNQYNQSVINDFLKTPSMFLERDIRILPPPTQKQIQTIKKLLADKSTDDSSIINLIKYLNINASPTLTKLCLQSMQNDTPIGSLNQSTPITRGVLMLNILENIYKDVNLTDKSTDEKIKYWQDLDKTTKGNHNNWKELFFDEKVNTLFESENIDLNTLNQMAESSYFREKHIDIIFRNTHKLDKVISLARIQFPKKLNESTYLPYLYAVDIPAKDIDNITRLFEHKNPKVTLDFIKQKLKDAPSIEQGRTYNALLQQPWLISYLSTESGAEDAAIIVQHLHTFLEEVDFITTFEEEQVLTSLIKLEYLNTPLANQLYALSSIDVLPETKAKIQLGILANISYESLGEVAEIYELIVQNNPNQPLSFLSTDFGLPVFDFYTEKERQTFIKLHKELSQKDFYIHYIEKFGVDFRTGKELDYDKIAKILTFDIPNTYAGFSLGVRDFYTYGIIKVLELEHQTSLGYADKLNEYQSFKVYNARSRAEDWRAFLLAKGYIKEKQFLNSLNYFN